MTEKDLHPFLHTSVLVSLKGITKNYQMGEILVPVLHHIDLNIYEKEFVVLLGPSGSGKTTLLNLLGGMDIPTSGSVIIDGRHLEKETEEGLTEFRRDTVGFVFQLFNLLPSLTARENVQVSTELSKNPLDIDEVLDLVGLGHRKDFFPSQMSGGEQQRVAIARAIGKRPKILLCDEPTGALDFETGKQVLKLLDQVNRELGMTVIIITHNVPIASMAHRVIRILSGTIQSEENQEKRTSPEEIHW